MIKNDLYLRALRGEVVERPPVWMMRQAGRYLPEFIALRDKYDFFTRCQTPELAAEITVQPIRRFPLDAAILFSDILVVPQAMGIDFKMKESVGPWLETPIRTKKQVEEIHVPDVNDTLGYVFDSIDITIEKLAGEVPLIGFAGSPWTILCYCVEGKGSKAFDIAKSFCFQQPEVAHQLLQKITDTTIAYLKRKVEKGVSAVQVFDSWGGMLSPEDYREFSWKYINQIVEALSPVAPVVVFAKGCWFALEEMAESKVSALGVDWTITPELARKFTQNKVTLQGNFDPARLHSSPETIKKMVNEMIHRFGKDQYIANLGHGILPNIPLENAKFNDKKSSKGDFICFHDVDFKKVSYAINTKKFNNKFNKVEHRNILGAIHNLGINFNRFGDIIVLEDMVYIFVDEEIADFIAMEFTKAGRVNLKFDRVDLTNVQIEKKYEDFEIVSSSFRLDSIVAKITNKSRSKIKEFLEQDFIKLKSGEINTFFINWYNKETKKKFDELFSKIDKSSIKVYLKYLNTEKKFNKYLKEEKK